MAKFLDKKERVIDFQLTPYGKHRLSVGQLKPQYYAFFDTGVTYDSEYASFSEVQTKIHERIKTETQFIEGILLFEEAENTVPESEYLGEISFHKAVGSPGDPFPFSDADEYYDGYTAYDSMIEELRTAYGSEAYSTDRELVEAFGFVYYPERTTSLFDLDIVPKKFVPKPNILSFESAIGDAKFEGENTQAAPAWKLLTCQGEITNIETRDTTSYNFTSASYDNEVKEYNIPQIDVKANYTLEISSPTEMLQEEVPSDFVSETNEFLDGTTIKLIRNDIMVYAEEVNTQLLTENFDVEVYEMIQVDGVMSKAGATITLCESSTILVGDTITIGDGITTATFEFIGPDPSDEVTTPGNIGVAIPSQYFYNNANVTKKGTILNLISAIRQDGGTPIPEVNCVNPGCIPRDPNDTIADFGVDQYPSPNYRGTDNSTPKKLFTPSTNKGRCKKNFSTETGGCYKGNHELQVTIAPAQISQVMNHDFATGGFELKLINQNVNIEATNPNFTITTLRSGAVTPATAISPAGFTGCFRKKATELKRKYFVDSIEQVVDGLMVAETEQQVKNPNLTEDSVEYYFNVLTDSQVSDKIACSCASTFNRDSYYIDIDFDCTEKDIERVYYDIYGTATSPEICNPPDRQANRPEELLPPVDVCEDE